MPLDNKLNKKFTEKKERDGSFNFNIESAEVDPGVAKVEPKRPEKGPEAGEVLKEKINKEDAPKQEKISRVIKKKISKIKDNAGSVATANDPKIFAIKNVLGKGLGSSYQKMSLDQQRKLLKEENQVAGEIKGVLSKNKVKVGKIFKLIFNWLKIIPFVSNFFAKQEAKIKTDRIIDLEKK